MLQVPPLNLPISIHAPRTGSDGPPGRTTALRSDFNPRSPHGERRCVPIKRRQAITFQSTLPARGATSTKIFVMRWKQFQSTLPARGATSAVIRSRVRTWISIHAPRTGSDDSFHLGFTAQGISIHAPRTGSDWALDLAHQRLHDFNPRSPHGERRPAHHHHLQRT